MASIKAGIDLKRVDFLVSQAIRPKARGPRMAIPAFPTWPRSAPAAGAASKRTIWPLAIVYLDGTLVVLARCCLREDFRMFRAERIATLAPTGASFRPQRAALLRDYQTILDAT